MQVINGDEMQAEILMQRKAREEMKERLLRDILCDMTICEIMGTDKMEYIKELEKLLKEINNENISQNRNNLRER